MKTLENNRRTAADNISHAQERQKKRHDKHLPEQPMEFKIGDQRYGTKIKAGEGRTRDQLELNVLFPTYHLKGNMGEKIAFGRRVEKKEAKNEKKLEEIKQALARGTELPETGEWTLNNAQEWKEKLPPAYWFYKIEEQLDLKTSYEDLSQKTFNKEAIQQTLTTVLVSSEKKAHIYEKRCNQQKTNSVPYNPDASSIIESTKRYHFPYPPSLSITKTGTNNNHLKMAESEIIGANHLEFTKSLFQQYSQQLGLNNNYFPAKSVFNFYINDKITDCIGKTVNIESTKENFYMELFQHTNLPRNYSFVPIIREINQTIKRYTQQQFPITYANKGKGRLQIPTVTPKGIQPST
ncbi:hypothetical protein G9A89_014886 [Geosiphon pyriformis]|nr:hypothetical protein G9A89_014886 [Geosiphon pyriformis]